MTTNPPTRPSGVTTRALPSPEAIINATGEQSQHSFRLSALKNYLGVPCATIAAGDTGAFVQEHLTSMCRAAKRGARALGLITPREAPDRSLPNPLDDRLTERGQLISLAASSIHGEPAATIEAFDELQNRPVRFVDEYPAWRPIVQALIAAHPGARPLLRHLYQQGEALTLVEFAVSLANAAPTVAENRLLAVGDLPCDDPVARLQALDQSRNSAPGWLTEPASYQSATTSHLKSLLFDAGVLDEPGRTSDRLDPTMDRWSLTPDLPDTVEAELTSTEGHQ